ncbi:MAG TPA: cytochrome b [Rhodocyclaceae bacterium]|nr:MAG: cytochrome b [Rhodocyclales bacterium CG_4_9_14_3_um_filter_68_10]HCX32699.1 cytochrome b [Rhodocyclaceae bacterium]
MNAPPACYTRTAIALHWLVAALIFATVPLGVYMVGLSLSPIKLRLYSYHKWIGITVLALTVLRILWRATHTPPPLPAALPHWQRAGSHAVHVALYVLIVAVPVSGWLMSSAKGVPTVWFGVLPLPDLVAKDKSLGEILTGVHQGLNIVLLSLVAAHIAAALKHRYIDRDDILERMLPHRPGGRA